MAADRDDSGDAWAWAQLEPEPTEREKALRDLFVEEYLQDYNEIAAASRCGFMAAFAKDMGPKLLSEAYVQKRLKTVAHTQLAPKDEEKIRKQQIKQALLREAHDRGPGSSHAARVSALTRLAVMYGMDDGKGGAAVAAGLSSDIVEIPVYTPEAWEKEAAVSQTKLMEDARN